MLGPGLRLAGVLAALVFFLPLTASAAGDPPLPTELRLYGSVLAGGANLSPAAQPVLALVNGRTCGSATTFLNPPSEPVDGGLTVYVVEVTADGSRANEIEGCGSTGDPVTIYFPSTGFLAPDPVGFVSGAVARFDISLTGGPLPSRLYLPSLANDNPR